MQPLHYAVLAGRVEVIKYLTDTLNVPISVIAEVSLLIIKTCAKEHKYNPHNTIQMYKCTL